MEIAVMLMNMHSSRRRVLAAGIVTVFLTVPAVSLASSPVYVSADGARSVAVSYSTIDLTTQRGADKLYQRLRYAAREVCEPLDERGVPSLRLAWSACYQQALSSAVAEVDRPLVTALYNNDRRSRPG
jgi:UrcA family protein